MKASLTNPQGTCLTIFRDTDRRARNKRSDRGKPRRNAAEGLFGRLRYTPVCGLDPKYKMPRETATGPVVRGGLKEVRMRSAVQRRVHLYVRNLCFSGTKVPGKFAGRYALLGRSGKTIGPSRPE